MTGILDRIRNTTVADLENVSGDFSDLAAPVYRSRRAPKEMIREVEGADDLKVDRPAPAFPGMTKAQDWSGDDATTASDGDARTEAQRNYMDLLIGWITEKDAETGARARTWTDGMTERNAWTPGKEGNASDWITRLKAKNNELKNAPKPVAPTAVTEDSFEDIPDGYYALADDSDTIKFYRVSTGRKGGPYAGRRFVKAQASDEFHNIRNAATRKAVMDAIRAIGWEASRGLYGQHIGRCGRCHRTLTDATSRACGIGPDCRGRM